MYASLDRGALRAKCINFANMPAWEKIGLGLRPKIGKKTPKFGFRPHLSERDFWKTNLPFLRLLKILYLRGENCLQNAHFCKQKWPCVKRPLEQGQFSFATPDLNYRRVILCQTFWEQRGSGAFDKKGVLLTTQKHRQNRSDSKVTDPRVTQKWLKSGSKLTRKWGFRSLWGWSAQVTFESLLGQFNYFCVSV